MKKVLLVISPLPTLVFVAWLFWPMDKPLAPATPPDPYWETFPTDQVKGVYVTASTALTPSLFNKVLETTKGTEINALVIDAKGNGGNLTDNPRLKQAVSQALDKRLFPIARIVAFLDNRYAEGHPESALKKPNGSLWLDRGGNRWLDPADPKVQEHVLDLSKKALDIGFKEIQYDYVRFPSDGSVDQIIYPAWDKKTPKDQVIKGFAEKAVKELKEYKPGTIVSADIFGYTFIVRDDLGIGQRLPDLLAVFDYVSPMIYPSHYWAGNFGFANPADYPYEVTKETLVKGNVTDPLLKKKIRPWIQGFNLGAIYDTAKIKKHKQALYDYNLTGWLIWNPRSAYQAAWFDKKTN